MLSCFALIFFTVRDKSSSNTPCLSILHQNALFYTHYNLLMLDPLREKYLGFYMVYNLSYIYHVKHCHITYNKTNNFLWLAKNSLISEQCHSGSTGKQITFAPHFTEVCGANMRACKICERKTAFETRSSRFMRLNY